MNFAGRSKLECRAGRSGGKRGQPQKQRHCNHTHSNLSSLQSQSQLSTWPQSYLYTLPQSSITPQSREWCYQLLTTLPLKAEIVDAPPPTLTNDSTTWPTKLRRREALRPSWRRSQLCRAMFRIKTRLQLMSSWRNSRNQYVRLGGLFECADTMGQPEAWQTTHTILQDSSCPIEARLFAATTLKGKVRSNEPPLKCWLILSTDHLRFASAAYRVLDITARLNTSVAPAI